MYSKPQKIGQPTARAWRGRPHLRTRRTRQPQPPRVASDRSRLGPELAVDRNRPSVKRRATGLIHHSSHQAVGIAQRHPGALRRGVGRRSVVLVPQRNRRRRRGVTIAIAAAVALLAATVATEVAAGIPPTAVGTTLARRRDPALVRVLEARLRSALSWRINSTSCSRTWPI